MHTGNQLMRFFLWILIGLSLAVGAGVYLKFQGKNEGQAAATLNSSKVNIQSTNLIGYWTFDGADTSSTTATDRGGANNGTITEAVGKPGKIGQALDFDGANDKVAMGDVLDRGDTDDLTLAGWFRRDTSDTDDTIIAKRNGIADTDDGYILYIDDATDQLIFEVSEIGGSDEYQLASTTPFTTTDWYHFIVVWDQDSAANSEIYINGVDDNATDTGTIGNIGDLTTALALTIGEETDNGNPFDGRLDDIRVYSNAFSTTQVADLYGVANSAKIINAGQDDMLTNGLVGYWTFDGNDIDWSDTGTEIKDVSGNGNHGAVSGLTRSSVKIGKLGQGLSFNGTGDYVLLPTNILTDFSHTSVCAWLNTSNPTYAQDGVSQTAVALYYSDVDQNSLRLGSSANAGEFFIAYRTGGATHHAASLNLVFVSNTWTHVCAVYDGANMTLYANGDSLTLGGVGSSGAPGGNYIGRAYSGGASWIGKIDDVRIYNRVLSATEIANLYNMGK